MGYGLPSGLSVARITMLACCDRAEDQAVLRTQRSICLCILIKYESIELRVSFSKRVGNVFKTDLRGLLLATVGRRCHVGSGWLFVLIGALSVLVRVVVTESLNYKLLNNRADRPHQLHFA